MMDRYWDTEQLPNALRRWKASKNEGYDFTIADMMVFGHLIGHPYNAYDNKGLIINTANPEVRRIITLINGENGYAILKMLEARKNEGSL